MTSLEKTMLSLLLMIVCVLGAGYGWLITGSAWWSILLLPGWLSFRKFRRPD